MMKMVLAMFEAHEERTPELHLSWLRRNLDLMEGGNLRGEDGFLVDKNGVPYGELA